MALRRAAAAQVEVAVPEAGLLADLECSSSWNGSGAASLSTSSSVAKTSICAGGQLGVLVALGPRGDLADDLDAELGAQPVGALGHLALAEDDLRDAGGVPEVDEDDAAVIAPAGDPPGQGDGLPGVLGPECPGLVRAHHGCCSPRW